MSRFTSDDAAYASNWRTILLVDSLIGWALVIVGVVLLAKVIGLVLLAAGIAYLVLGALRARRWRRLRTEAGLE